MLFWIIAAALSLVVTGTLVLTLLRYRHIAAAGSHDLTIYRDQLEELDRDLQRGVMAADEAERTRTEISRRILEADRKGTTAAVLRTGGGTKATAAALVVAITLGALLLYQRIGAPGYPDLPMALRIAASERAMEERPAQAAAEAGIAPASPAEAPDPSYLKLVERLRGTMAEKRDDPRGYDLLARSESILGRFREAHLAKASAIALKKDTATADDYVELADLMIQAAGGYVSPEAELALRAALTRAPEHGAALYYSGLMFLQNGRPDLGFRIWRKLVADGAADAPWQPAIRSQIELAAQLAGVEYTLPPVADTAPILPPVADTAPALPPVAGTAPALPGPDADAVTAASEMTEQDRNEMIRSMVDRLSERLASEGGTPGEWARLIGALAVLGDTDQARAIWTEAQGVFASDDAALQEISRAAISAGLSE